MEINSKKEDGIDSGKRENNCNNQKSLKTRD